jgi:acyl-CoA hydrolase
MVVGIKVDCQNIRTGEVIHCNSSYFSMVARDENGKGVQVPGLIISNETEIRRFLRSIKHIKMRNERKIEFSASSFQPEKYRDALKDYKVKIEL